MMSAGNRPPHIKKESAESLAEARIARRRGEELRPASFRRGGPCGDGGLAELQGGHELQD